MGCLANTLAGMRIQDEISSFGRKSIALIQAGWDPVMHVEKLYEKCTVSSTNKLVLYKLLLLKKHKVFNYK
ncbi:MULTISPECIES: hypothetical protein [Providencia]|uniref:hypothetical protein n=1 Tax=Providencia TaxID=586 RepID=UPI0015EC537F|nr:MULTISPECIES: hypothetical protein [unclassified Providencia]QLQ95639.1 hypothetical protein H0907_10465 [Providencia rettgeri]WEB82369.1 hypothetical protein LVJ10_10485 [Providencia rettgeri]HCH7934024.1 hypothetical protein [Providencia rettgeri]